MSKKCTFKKALKTAYVVQKNKNQNGGVLKQIFFNAFKATSFNPSNDDIFKIYKHRTISNFSTRSFSNKLMNFSKYNVMLKMHFSFHATK